MTHSGGQEQGLRTGISLREREYQPGITDKAVRNTGKSPRVMRGLPFLTETVPEGSEHCFTLLIKDQERPEQESLFWTLITTIGWPEGGWELKRHSAHPSITYGNTVGKTLRLSNLYCFMQGESRQLCAELSINYHTFRARKASLRLISYIILRTEPRHSSPCHCQHCGRRYTAG